MPLASSYQSYSKPHFFTHASKERLGYNHPGHDHQYVPLNEPFTQAAGRRAAGATLTGPRRTSEAEGSNGDRIGHPHSEDLSKFTNVY